MELRALSGFGAVGLETRVSGGPKKQDIASEKHSRVDERVLPEKATSNLNAGKVPIRMRILRKPG